MKSAPRRPEQTRAGDRRRDGEQQAERQARAPAIG
jgi:hypothetical protein